MNTSTPTPAPYRVSRDGVRVLCDSLTDAAKTIVTLGGGGSIQERHGKVYRSISAANQDAAIASLSAPIPTAEFLTFPAYDRQGNLIATFYTESQREYFLEAYINMKGQPLAGATPAIPARSTFGWDFPAR